MLGFSFVLNSFQIWDWLLLLSFLESTQIHCHLDRLKWKFSNLAYRSWMLHVLFFRHTSLFYNFWLHPCENSSIYNNKQYCETKFYERNLLWITDEINITVALSYTILILFLTFITSTLPILFWVLKMIRVFIDLDFKDHLVRMI